MTSNYLSRVPTPSLLTYLPLPAMDQCLRLQEIVEAICDKADSAEALALALTCKGFLDAGLGSLWKEIDSFTPLVACMPADLFSKRALNNNGDLHYSLRRAIFPTDVERYLTFYARRIRTLALGGPKRVALLGIDALLALQLVVGGVPGALAPRLQSFQWFSGRQIGEIVDPNFFAFLSQSMLFFISESVTSISVDVTGADAPLLSTSLRLCAQRPAHLEKLVFLGTRTFLDDYLFASNWESLRIIEVQGISAQGINRLAALPNLASLSISAKDDSKVPNMRQYPTTFHRQATIAYGFQSLRKLEIQAAQFEYLRTFMQYLPPYNVIQSIKFLTHLVSQTSSRNSCQDALLSMAEYANPRALNHIHVRDGTIFKSVPPETTASEQKREDLVDISVLYKFKQLRALTVHCEAGVRVTPRDVASIVDTWPNVKTLDLCTTFPSPLPPSIDHTHLLQVLDGCPSLRHLGLRFDATKISAHDHDAAKHAGLRRGPYSRLQALSVGESPITSPERVTEFIKAHFPKLKALDMSYSHRPSTVLDIRPAETESEAPQIDEVWDGIRESLGLVFDLDQAFDHA